MSNPCRCGRDGCDVCDARLHFWTAIGVSALFLVGACAASRVDMPCAAALVAIGVPPMLVAIGVRFKQVEAQERLDDMARSPTLRKCNGCGAKSSGVEFCGYCGGRRCASAD